MTTIAVLLVALVLLTRAVTRQKRRLRAARARLEVLSERAAAERLRPRGHVEAAPIEAPASVGNNGNGGMQ